MKTITTSFKLTNKAFKLLQQIKEAGAVEYRDYEYRSLKEFIKEKTEGFEPLSEEQFLSRNFMGTLGLAEELASHDLIEDVEDSFHRTYKISALGEYALKNAK